MLLTVTSLSLLAFSAWYVPARLKALLGLRRVLAAADRRFLLLAGLCRCW